MSTNELREAADRVKELVDFPNIVDNERRWYEIERPARLLADNFRAEHPPDDDTPIDESWLMAVGGQQGRFQSDILLGPIGRGVNREVGKPYWFVRSWPIPDEAAPRTRGQLRRLCESLGIQLKEGK